MKMNDILKTQEGADALTPAEQVEKIAEFTAAMRAKYGNDDAEISTPEIHTTDGLQDMEFLSDESKVAIARSEWENIKSIAIEFTKSFEGAKLDKKIEELVAISPILANINRQAESEYL